VSICEKQNNGFDDKTSDAEPAPLKPCLQRLLTVREDVQR